MKNNLTIAIDGPSGVGKSTLSRMLAHKLGYKYVDTGAMYRVAALMAYREEIDLKKEEKINDLCKRITIDQHMLDDGLHTYLNGEDVSDEIRTPIISKLSSDISALAPIRKRLVEIQREMGSGGGVVLEGRDIATVVFPDADVKFYLDASLDERSKRRYNELKEKGVESDLQNILNDIRKRDRNDSSREISPLKKAEQAILIDTTNKNIEEVLKDMLDNVRRVESAA